MKQRQKRSKGGRKPEGRKPPEKVGRVQPAKPLSTGRKWLFRFIALIILPLLVLGGTEAALRLAGYGYSTNFFKKIRIAGKNYFINNENFTLRFFPPQLARWPDPFIFPAVKPPDTIRIFIFGESAAMGDPQPSYSASRYLNVLLRERCPNKKFEVINLGITAINSHVILPIARDCVAHDGDFWIVYMGNNEMVGPYGAATVFGAKALPLGLVRFNLALQETRIGQLLVSTARHFAGKSQNPSWGGMEMFLKNQIPPGDPRKETVYHNFDVNLRDIVADGMNSGAKVILNTVAVNLKDSPPFASLSNSNLPAADLQQFRQVFDEAKTLEARSNYLAADELFCQAVKLDPKFAETHFRLARCDLALANTNAAVEFQLACDLDALPFRTDTRLNHDIRKLAADRAGNGLLFCDAEHDLAQASPEHILGDETFFEHVHFNFDGNYRLGKLWADQIAQQLSVNGIKPASSNWVTQADCDRALGLSIWNRQFVLQAVMRRFGAPPLSTQFNNPERLGIIRARELKLREAEAQPGAVQRVRAEFAAAIKAAPTDNYLYEGLANFLEATKDPAGAIAAYRKVCDLMPNHFYACFQLGRLLREQHQPELGEPFLKQAAQLRPSLPEGWLELGNCLSAENKNSAALECMEHAAAMRPQDSSYLCYVGQILGRLNRHAEAIEHYRRAIRMDPDFWEAHFELAGELVTANQPEAALHEYSDVLRINPRHVPSQLNLGVMLVRFNRLDEAIVCFQNAVKLEPNNQTAREYLASALAHRNKMP